MAKLPAAEAYVHPTQFLTRDPCFHDQIIFPAFQEPCKALQPEAQLGLQTKLTKVRR